MKSTRPADKLWRPPYSFFHRVKTSVRTSLKHRYSVTLDDDPMVHKIIERALGFESIPFTSAEPFLRAMRGLRPLVVFVDINLGNSAEERDGIDLVPDIRRRWPYCPLIIVTSNPHDNAVGRALASGADDFLKKPLEINELVARSHARIEAQSAHEARRTLCLADITLDTEQRVLRARREKVHLSPKAASLLSHLMNAKGTLVTRESLKGRGWGSSAVSDNVVDRQINEVRAALRDVGTSLELKNEYAKGFSLEIPKPPQTPRRKLEKAKRG